MIEIHHLRHSRSTRIIWLLEEIGTPYRLVSYDRDPLTGRAPPAMRQVHPLGKAPTVIDGDRVIAESGAIIEYLEATYGGGRFGPTAGEATWPAYLEWLHFGESAGMLGVMLRLLGGRDGLPAQVGAYADESVALALDLVERALDGHDFLVGDRLTGADVQMQFTIELALTIGYGADQPAIVAYKDRMTARPAYVRAIAQGGPTMLPRLAAAKA